LSAEEQQLSLPSIQTGKGADAVFESLLKLSKQGKLAGYAHETGAKHAVVDAHGNPFDSDLVIEYADGEIRLNLMMRKKMPAIFMALLLITVWPGLPLTDSFLYSFGWYERLMGESIQTWMWYLPLTILPIPFVWKSSIKKSRVSAREHAMETVEKIKAVAT